MSMEARRIRLLMELRKEGISDTVVLSALERVPRELFVPENFQDQAYENTALPIGSGQTISQPSVVAYMTQELRIGPRHRVLEVGTGSGYQAAILSHLCRRVYTIERHRELLKDAEACFAELRLNNITTRSGDGSLGWPEQAPFDRIIGTAASDHRPDTLIGQLGGGGIMIIPVGSKGLEQYLMRYENTEDGLVEERLWPVRFVPLIEEAS